MAIQHILLALLIAFIWGFNFVVIKIGLHEVSPFLLCAIRFLLASIPLVFIIKRPKIPFKILISYGLIMFTLQFALLFLSLAVGTTAGLASLLLQVQVFFTLLLAALFLKDTPKANQIIGAIISFIGVGIIGMHTGGDISLLGFILVISAAAAWSVGNLISKKIGAVNLLALVVWGSLCAWPPFLLLELTIHGFNGVLYSIQNMSWTSIAAIAYIVYPTTLLAYVIWTKLLHQYPMTMIAPFTLLVPIFGILSSVIVLGEPIYAWKIAAMLLLLTGAAINLYGSLFYSYIKKAFPVGKRAFEV